MTAPPNFESMTGDWTLDQFAIWLALRDPAALTETDETTSWGDFLLNATAEGSTDWKIAQIEQDILKPLKSGNIRALREGVPLDRERFFGAWFAGMTATGHPRLLLQGQTLIEASDFRFDANEVCHVYPPKDEEGSGRNGPEHDANTAPSANGLAPLHLTDSEQNIIEALQSLYPGIEPRRHGGIQVDRAHQAVQGWLDKNKRPVTALRTFERLLQKMNS